jgi:hypothetical protein
MFIDHATLRRLLRVSLRKRWRSRKRLTYFFLTIIILIAVYLLNSFTRFLDEVFFPGYRRVKIEPPLIITANPRSGTTFLHRLLSLDNERFTSFRLRHTLLSSISMARLMRFLGPIDRFFGRPIGRLIDRGFEGGFQGWDTIHRVGFNRLEEDEGLFMFCFASPAMYGIFPFFQEVSALRFADRLPRRRRRALVRYYRTSVQRFLYNQSANRVFLLKSVLLAGRMRIISEVFPDARIVHLIRSPYEVLPSFVSMFTTMWKIHSPDISDDSDCSREWARLGVDYYRYFHRNRGLFDNSPFITIPYRDLVADPKAVIESIYRELGFPLNPSYLKRLEVELSRQRGYRSSHSYDLVQYGLNREWVYENLKELFEFHGLEK